LDRVPHLQCGSSGFDSCGPHQISYDVCMAHFKRRKPRRAVRCTMCTDARAGNSAKQWTNRRPMIAIREVEARRETRNEAP
jgi:hypothetical protein